MTNIAKLYKIETSNKKTYYFNSFEDAGSFIKKNKSSSMSTCYGEEHKQDGISYYYLAKAEVEITINQEKKEASRYVRGEYYFGDKYTIAPSLLHKKLEENEDNFFVVMDRIYQPTSGDGGPKGDASHEIIEKIPDHKYESFSWGEGCYEEKILLLTSQSAQLYDIDRTQKIYLGENAQVLKAKIDACYNEQFNLFQTKRQKLTQEISAKQAELTEVEKNLSLMKDECGPELRMR